jgi:3-keto-5-aminohexanoate cleavage enzyme
MYKFSENKKYILNLAANGIIPTKEMTAFVPVTPHEVISDIDQCMSVGGITYLHLHARDENGNPSNDIETYKKFIAPIKEKYKDLVICVSCSGRLDSSFEGRSGVLDIQGDLKPEMASLTLGSLNFSQSVSINSPDMIVRLAERMQERGIKPELEIFDLGMMNYAHYMIAKGYLKPPFYFNIILGNIFSAQSKLSHLATILQELPDNAIWSTGGIGNAQIPATLMALSQGGGIRTGIEDNIWMDPERTKLATNMMLVERVHKLAALSGLQMLTPTEFKNLIE